MKHRAGETEPTGDGPETGAEPKPPAWRHRVMGATALCAALLAGGQYYANEPLLAPALAVGFVTERGVDQVPGSIMAAINEAAAKPTDPELAAMIDKYDGKLMAEHYHDYTLEQAKRAGLTLIDPRPYRDRIDKATTIAEVMAATDQYTKKLGFDTELHQKNDPLDIGVGANPVDVKGLNLAKLKIGTQTMLGSLGYMPKQLYDYADIRQLRIVQSFNGVDNPVIGNFQPTAETNPVTGVLYIPVQSLYTSSFVTYMHEISHRIDYQMNGLWGMERDYNLLTLNDKSFHYGQPGNSRISADVNRTYAATNPVEDKASLYQSMVNGLDGDLLNNPAPVIRNKYRTLLGRLDENVPGIAQYLEAISVHETLVKFLARNFKTDSDGK